MNKFKSFFTFLAFTWLCGCAVWAISRWISVGGTAWLGLFISSLALPAWMVLRFLRPQKFRGDLREAPAFITVLAGLAIILLTDTDKGGAVYLALYNLFILLLYLYHLSAFAHPPPQPAPESRFPVLVTRTGSEWRYGAAEEGIAEGESAESGALLIFLRGSFCADSRALLMQLPQLNLDLQKLGVRLCLFSTEAESHWRHNWPDGIGVKFIQLSSAEANRPFVAEHGAPFILRLLKPSATAVCRPSQWLLDRDGVVLWRHLPGNYRTPGDVSLLRSQLSRLNG